MTVNKGNGWQSFHPQSLQNVVNTQSCMKKVHPELWNWYKFEKYPVINFWSNHPVFASCPLFHSFLSCHSSKPSLHFAPIFPSLHGENISVPNFGALNPLGVTLEAREEQHWVGSLCTYGAVSWLAKCHADTCGKLCDAVGSRLGKCLFVLSDNSLCCSVYPLHPSFFFLS